jgi:drug/metabolite transporter (DMT)-like permease
VADLALLLLTLAWGTTFLLVKNALDGTSTGVFLLLRFGLAAAALAAVVIWRGERPTRTLLRHGVLLGLTMFGGFALQTLGLRSTTPARSGFLTGLSVLIVPFLARFLFRRHVHAAAWAGVALAVAGLLFLTRPFGTDLSAEIRAGDLLTAGCAVAFALQIIYASEWTRHHPVALLTLVQVGTTVVLVPLLLALEPVRLAAAPALWATVLYTGLAMTAGAYFVQNWAQRHTTAVRAALIFSLEPVAAALFSHLVGGEPLLAYDWAGGALIVAGVILGEVGGAFEARQRAAAAPGPAADR